MSPAARRRRRRRERSHRMMSSEDSVETTTGVAEVGLPEGSSAVHTVLDVIGPEREGGDDAVARRSLSRSN